METFTVIVPTLNRCQTLAHVLESCIVQQDERFRIVVSDNHSSDGTAEVIKEFQQRDSRVEYIRPPEQLGMAEHYEFALNHVREGFILILGSDDGLLPGAIQRARAAHDAYPHILAIHAVHGAMFHYPEFQGEDAGFMHMRFSPRVEIRRSSEWLGRVARSECHIGELPQPYCRTFVHASLFKRILERSGRYIHSPIPDFSMAANLGAVSEEYLYVSPCFAITGLSPAGTGASMIYPSADRKAEQRFFQLNGTPIHPKVAYTRSEMLLIGEVLLRAKEAGLLPSDFAISWDKMLARAFLQLKTAHWSEEDRQKGIDAIKAVGRNMGCPEVLDSVESHPTLRAWKHSLPFNLDWHDDPWEFIFDTRPLKISGIHEAARFAEVLIQAGVKAEAHPLHLPHATEEEIRNWGLLQLAKQNAKLRAELERSVAESERRGAERDKAKAKVSALEHKLERARNKPKDPSKKTLVGKLKKMLARS